MATVPWKNAATLIILARNQLSHHALTKKSEQFNEKQLPDYNCMLLKRNAQSKFFANAFVFPGGATEHADFSRSWLEHFADHGFDQEKLASQFIISQHNRIPLYKDALKYDNCIPEVGYRIGAIRETFEETGVLFCKPVHYARQKTAESVTLIAELSEWQKKVHHNPENFLLLCKTFNLYPDIWSLYEWSNWLTPVNMGPKRYDTIFYLCVLDNIPQVQIDNKEITQVKWIDPVSAVRQHIEGHIWLAPPQLYELCRMANFDHAEKLKTFAKTKQLSGIEQWLPIRHQAEEGFMTVLPGDSLYPSRESQVPLTEEENTVENSGTLKNRMIFCSPNLLKIICNVVDPHGHRPPRNLTNEIIDETVRSKM